MTELRRTPLADLHERLGGRMVPFAGFAMPVQYTSIVDEHRAARETAALFDVSHMGQIVLAGAAAGAYADYLCTRAMSTLAPGRVRYALLCNESGGVIDDLTVYRTGDDAFLLCVNAANTAVDRAWIESHATAGVAVRDESDETGLLALQGPASVAVLGELGGSALGALRRFQFARSELAGRRVLASRTGYTGADGFELYCDARDAAALFEALLEAGRKHGLVPAGLGARDTLRLEAALPLYGQELDADTTPLDAGLARFVELERDFLGAGAIRRRHREGRTRALVGFEVIGRGIARAGYPVLAAGVRVGHVTSGGPSPTLQRAIGLAYVPPALSARDTALEIEVRGRAIPARVVETPFVSGKAAGRPNR
jgi:glycine cleavage system T protein (aminomethyltransferase)